METHWLVEQVTERPGVTEALLQRVEWFKTNPEWTARQDEVPVHDDFPDQFLDVEPEDPDAEMQETGERITLNVTDGPELHPLDKVRLRLSVVALVES